MDINYFSSFFSQFSKSTLFIITFCIFLNQKNTTQIIIITKGIASQGLSKIGRSFITESHAKNPVSQKIILQGSDKSEE
jgi:hypothetical protein